MVPFCRTKLSLAKLAGLIFHFTEWIFSTIYLYLGVKRSSIVLVIVVKSKCGFHPQSVRALMSSRTSGQLSAAKDGRNIALIAQNVLIPRRRDVCYIHPRGRVYI